MKILSDLVEFVSGTVQFRIKESTDTKAITYRFYSQSDMDNDLKEIYEDKNINLMKEIRTFDNVSIVKKGDLIFNLISGRAAIVKKNYENYIFTQNFVKLEPKKKLNKEFLLYLLNEEEEIQKQFQLSLQGSKTLKYSMIQLKNLKVFKLPSLEKQKLIGEIYIKQEKLNGLKERKLNLEKIIIKKKLKEALKNDRIKI
ncbi:hypothetical protein [Fusobacterium sp.]|uniref:hypothetical protein n=1 Tax=Fusobacterium TaxID=848 RepID=UPI0025BD3E1D|nr:hypothetical protein [Fusobacterium sp.]MCI5725632.1 hypothetical protein [Fusobacterium sp.]MCI7224068.1 hypothetical protein [Fusobacterium sp.]MDY5795890.1 hypothetical protein [Fusobacterium gastrosuis]